MVTVHHNGMNLAIVFKTDVCGRLTKTGIESVEQIACALVGPEGRVYGAGNAFRSPKDDDDHFYGMELAFGRAVAKLIPLSTPNAKKERAKFWNVFFNSINQQQIADAQELDEFLTLTSPSIRVVVPAKPELTEAQQTELNRLRFSYDTYGKTHQKFDTPLQAECDVCVSVKSRIEALEAAGTERALSVAA